MFDVRVFDELEICYASNGRRCVMMESLNVLELDMPIHRDDGRRVLVRMKTHSPQGSSDLGALERMMVVAGERPALLETSMGEFRRAREENQK